MSEASEQIKAITITICTKHTPETVSEGQKSKNFHGEHHAPRPSSRRAMRALTAYWNPTFENSRSATPVHLYAIHSPFDYILRAEIERRESDYRRTQLYLRSQFVDFHRVIYRLLRGKYSIHD